MQETAAAVALRSMELGDIPAVLVVQEPGTIATLAEVFPQHLYPFPRDEIALNWQQEIWAPDIDCYVVTLDGSIVGFAATRDDELLHFGIAPEHWGSGVAPAAHQALLDQMQRNGKQHIWLRVFTGNGRGRRFYEKLGWNPTGDRTRSTFPPHPELLRYERVC